MKNILILFSILFLTNISLAQTKLIFHKSHSGNTASFSLALESKSYFGDSNFGHGPAVIHRLAQLDSLVSLSDSTVVMVTSEVCFASDNRIEVSDTIWKAGRDTILHSSYFSNTKTKNEVMGMLDNEFHFFNPSSSVVMIGFAEETKIEIDTTTPPNNKLFGGETITVSSKKELRKYKREEKKKVRKKRKAAKKAAKKKSKSLGDAKINIPNKNLSEATTIDSAIRWGTASVLGLLLAMLGMTFWKLRR